ncbi:MAG: HlyD family type I secretion periplasmic adaptor subunit [Proteobacteria bacterium]|nr:MAG: HlyD family type I secretion periplasmic adaptor subunit [Pseudomonadota bacterium]
MSAAAEPLSADALDFSPAILRLQREPPSPLPRLVLALLGVLILVLAGWSIVGRLDIIAVAPGRLVPSTYVKVVQPVDAGVIKELLVREGDSVKAGQVMVRMDPSISDADGKQLQTQVQLARLALRRIDAELAGTEPQSQADDSQELFSQMASQYRARRQTHLDELAAERAVMAKAEHDLKGALEMEAKLKQTLPIYQDQERSWAQLEKEGFAGHLLVEDRRRVRIEVQQELKAQVHTIDGLRAAMTQSKERQAQIESNYRQLLYNERVETTALLEKAEQERQKQSIHQDMLELRAPQDGVVKELATHTEGAVLSPGTVLMTIVPANEPLRAEVWVSNQDRGFVRDGQKVKVKIDPYPFQKYGMVDGVVKSVSADASEQSPAQADSDPRNPASRYRFRAIVELKSQYLQSDEVKLQLTPGMQVDAEIALGDRTVLEYILSPVRKAFHEAARER